MISNLLYAIGVIAVIGWLVGYLGLHVAGGLLHLLLLLAVISVILGVIKGGRL